MPEVTANVRVAALGATQAADEIEKCSAALTRWRGAGGPAAQSAASVAQNMGLLSLEGPKAERAVSRINFAFMSMVQSGSAGAGSIRSLEMGLVSLMPRMGWYAIGIAALAEGFNLMAAAAKRAQEEADKAAEAVRSAAQQAAGSVGTGQSRETRSGMLRSAIGRTEGDVATYQARASALQAQIAEESRRGAMLTSDNLDPETSHGRAGAVRSDALDQLKRDLADVQQQLLGASQYAQAFRQELEKLNPARDMPQIFKKNLETERAQRWESEIWFQGEVQKLAEETRQHLAGSRQTERAQRWESEVWFQDQVRELAAETLRVQAENRRTELAQRWESEVWFQDQVRKQEEEANAERAATARDTGMLAGSAFAAGMQALIAEKGGLKDVSRAMLTELRNQFLAKAAGQVADGVADLAMGNFVGAAGHGKAALLYSAAAATAASLGGGGVGGSSGGGGGGSGGYASGVSGSIADNRGEVTLTITGGILDMSDPRQLDAFRAAMEELAGRRVVIRYS